MCTRSQFAALSIHFLTLVLVSALHAQEVGNIMQAGEEVGTDHLDLGHSVMSVWPSINLGGVEELQEALDRLIATYEANRVEADENEDVLNDLVEETKRNEEIVDAKIEVAKRADNEAERDRLEELKDRHERRRKYLERIRSIRELEKETAQARIAYLEALQRQLDLAAELARARNADHTSRDLLAIEEELIEQGKEVARLNDRLADRAKDLSNKREDAFERRKDIFEEIGKAGIE